MEWFLFIVGAFMTFSGAYIKNQMMLADLSASPRQEQARKFIDSLTETAHGDFIRVFKVTQGTLVFGLIILVIGVTALFCKYH